MTTRGGGGGGGGGGGQGRGESRGGTGKGGSRGGKTYSCTPGISKWQKGRYSYSPGIIEQVAERTPTNTLAQFLFIPVVSDSFTHRHRFLSVGLLSSSCHQMCLQSGPSWTRWIICEGREGKEVKGGGGGGGGGGGREKDRSN